MPKRQLKKRSDGRYELKIYVGLDENKKKKYKTVYGKTVAEVEEKERRLKSQQDKGIDIVSADDSYQKWLDRLKAVKETELTESEYDTFVARASHFSKKFGNTPLNEIGQ